MLYLCIANEKRIINIHFSYYRGVEQLVARQAHNLEVACSSLASATFVLGSPLYSGFPSFRNGKVGRISDDVSVHIGCVSEQC